MADISFIPNPVVVGLQTVPFLLTLGGLHVLIFKPMLEYLEGRDDAIDGAGGRAKELEEQLSAKTEEYEKKLHDAKVSITELRAEARERAMEEAEVIVSAARKETEAELEQALTRISAESAAARGALASTSQQLADEIAAQVLGRAAAG